MFVDTDRGLIVPQQEHARLAGFLALHWGNKDFDLPVFGKEALVEGITFHHLGYGANDTIDFRQLDDEGIARIFVADTRFKLSSPEADLVNLFHQQRLIENRLKTVGESKLSGVKSKVEKLIDE